MQVNKRVRDVLIGLASALTVVMLSASSCDSTSSNDKQTKYSDQQGNQAQKKWGNPQITNFSEYKMAVEVYELRDRQDLVMYAYLQGNDGSLRCYGQVVGYGIPYSTQLTPPYDSYSSSGAQYPVREPNALFMPDSAEATWIRVIDPATGKTLVEYVEPRLIISPVKRPCKPTDQ